MHVYVCILCVCLRRPKPFVCRPTHRERIIYGQRERETIEIDERPAFGRRMRALLVPLQHPIEHVSRRPRKDICHHLSFVCVCVCAVSGTCSWCSIFFFSAVLFFFSYKRRINALDTFVFLSMSFGLHRTQTAGPEYMCTRIPLYFLLQYAMDRRGMLIRPSSAYLHPCVLPCGV